MVSLIKKRFFVLILFDILIVFAQKVLYLSCFVLNVYVWFLILKFIIVLDCKLAYVFFFKIILYIFWYNLIFIYFHFTVYFISLNQILKNSFFWNPFVICWIESHLLLQSILTLFLKIRSLNLILICISKRS